MLTIVGLLSLGAAGCSSKELNEPDTPDVPDQQVEEATVALSIQVSVPTENGTRNSATLTDGSSEDGTEDGQENENQVKNAIIYFYQKLEAPEEGDITDSDTGDLRFLASYILDENGNSVTKNNDGEEGNYTFTIKIDKNEYERFNDYIAGKSNIVLLVVANISEDISEEKILWNESLETKDPRYAVIPHEGDDFGTDKKGKAVPMSSKDFYYVNLSSIKKSESYEAFRDQFNKDPGTGGEVQSNYTIDLTEDEFQIKNSEDGNTKLNSSVVIPLERDVARIDFKPKAKDGEFEANVYQVENVPNLNLKLTKLQVFNVKNKINAFRQTATGTVEGYLHASDDFDKRKDVFLFGEERGSSEDQTLYNWIADYDWSNKLKPGPPDLEFGNKPVKANNSPIYKVDGTTGSITIDGLTSRPTVSVGKFEYYYPWRYLPENTVPTTSLMIQKYCSGVAFTMVMCKPNGTRIEEADFMTQEEQEKELEKIDGHVEDTTFGKIIIRKSLENSRYKYKDASGNEQETNFYLLEIGDEEVYVEKTDAGFEMTYYLFMRHNYPTGHIQGKVDPMQYATVRNNVYKISINSIKNLPKPYEPDDPVETVDYYMSVDIKVLAWVRRDITVSW